MRRRLLLALVPAALILGVGPLVPPASAAPICIWTPVATPLNLCIGK
jgi:hypothetical protein